MIEDDDDDDGDDNDDDNDGDDDMNGSTSDETTTTTTLTGMIACSSSVNHLSLSASLHGWPRLDRNVVVDSSPFPPDKRQEWGEEATKGIKAHPDPAASRRNPARRRQSSPPRLNIRRPP
ncbi:hypothetical protein CDD80_6724 [Ophiocordyceps camponoti-rufipedis]|uniref:Uncharacterized protein n=1 Tax=Ophiocordyceps camponoti-rufipedis TaxID=2004952 RepID=A0A2C5XEF9_9HYPO|nr:hypothetical protein CDD80_6724 [Ophiocordyceps camponoti-rufipedis]